MPPGAPERKRIHGAVNYDTNTSVHEKAFPLPLAKSGGEREGFSYLVKRVNGF
jgi:hypothetical protein